MNKNMLAVALASLLVGGVAVAAYQNFSGSTTEANVATAADAQEPAASVDGDLAVDDSIATPHWADVLEVEPVSETRELYAAVIGTDPVRETSTVSTPREVCQDVLVEQPAPVKDHNRVVGTVAGALIGGALGNQVGGGNGRKLATAAGAIGGGYAGRTIQTRQQENRTVLLTEQQCRTVSDTSESSRVVGYNVTYRNPDGTTGTMRTGSEPGSRIALGSEDHVVGYDVTYRYQGHEQVIRMDDRPGERLPVVDGEVMTQTALVAGDTTRG